MASLLECHTIHSVERLHFNTGIKTVCSHIRHLVVHSNATTYSFSVCVCVKGIWKKYSRIIPFQYNGDCQFRVCVCVYILAAPSTICRCHVLTTFTTLKKFDTTCAVTHRHKSQSQKTLLSAAALFSIWRGKILLYISPLFPLTILIQ